MCKLKLDSLHVESFETSSVSRERGTVDAHVREPVSLETYNADRCGYTNFFDCTYGCSHFTTCSDSVYDCTQLTGPECP